MLNRVVSPIPGNGGGRPCVRLDDPVRSRSQWFRRTGPPAARPQQANDAMARDSTGVTLDQLGLVGPQRVLRRQRDGS